jgi:predicted GIY-YIG superfamily endonuclease
MSFWVYILRCADNSYYTGHTDNLEKRIGEHETGAVQSCYTFKRRPLQLVFSQDCTTREEALAAEQQIKGWSRKKKEAMMRGDWAEVSRLAKSKPPIRTDPPSAVHPDPPSAVHPDPPSAVHPELVEGPSPSSVHPSTSSGRTEDEVAR